MLPSLLFLLVVVFSTLANVRGGTLRGDLGSDVELSWYRETTGKSLEDAIQKLAK
jgi:hypothetical protein